MAAKNIVFLMIIGLGTIQAANPLENAASVRLKSESHALSWSLSCTALPILAGIGILTHSEKDEWEVTGGLLISSGIMLGPGVGYIYAGKPSRIWVPMAARMMGFLMFGFSMQCEDVGGDDIRTECKMNPIAAVGLALFVGSIVYALTKVDNAAREHNAELSRSTIAIAPSINLERRELLLVASWSF